MANAMGRIPPERLQHINLDASNAEHSGNYGFVSFAEEGEARARFIWRFYLLSTLAIYISIILFVAAAVVLLIFADGKRSSLASLAMSLVPISVTLIWRPHTKLLMAHKELTNISLATSRATELERAIRDIDDPLEKSKILSYAMQRVESRIDR